MKLLNTIRNTRPALKQFTLGLAASAVVFGAGQSANAATIWDGPTITFTKADNADWTLPANQDRITPNVWITRGDTKQIFNIKIEVAAGGWETDSPKDTQWAWPGQFGNSSDPAEFKATNYANLNFTNFDLCAGGNPSRSVEFPAVVHLITDDIYLEVQFTSWTDGHQTGKGGFSYTRSTLLVPITYGFTETVPVDPVASQEGWTKVFPTTGDLWANYGSLGWFESDDGHLGAGWEDADTILGRSPQFTLNGSGDLTFTMIGTPSPDAAPVAPSAIPEIAIVGGGFIGVALRDVATDTYVLWKAHPGTVFPPDPGHPVWSHLSFTKAQLAPYVIPGATYTLDFIDYSKLGAGGNGWMVLGEVSIPGFSLSTACNIKTFGPGAVIDQGAQTITWSVPLGTTPEQVAALKPTYTLSAYATCNQPNHGIPSPALSTTVPVHYIVTAQDGTTTKDYTVSIIEVPVAYAITPLDVSASATGAEILNDAVLVEANHFYRFVVTAQVLFAG